MWANPKIIPDIDLNTSMIMLNEATDSPSVFFLDVLVYSKSKSLANSGSAWGSCSGRRIAIARSK